MGVVLATLVACAPKGPVRAALYEDLPALQREIARAERAGEIDRRLLSQLAEAVAAREVASAAGPSGARRVRALRGCARPMLDALRARSRKQDDVAAEAMLVRLWHNDVDSERLIETHHNAASGAWRAVAARAAIRPRDVPLRRRWFEDPDERVRRAALEAAALAPEASDLPVLLESFRLDPDPLSRSLAARAAGNIGGETAVLGLKDRYARAEEPDRLALVDAFAMPASLTAGGARQLRTIAEGKQGIVSVAAAHALLRTGDQDGALIGLLLTALAHDSQDERRLAITFVPYADPRVPTALQAAAKDPNPLVRVMALRRLLEVREQRPLAQKILRELAAKQDPAAAEARDALARVGDRSVAAALIRDVEKGHPLRRQSAALSLFHVGEHGKAAIALGDADPGVRIAVSCGVLASIQR